MKTIKPARSLKPAHILVGSILALVALPAQPAQAVPLVTTDLKGYWSFDTNPGGGVVPETSGAGDGPRNGLFVGDPTYTVADVPVGFGGSAADLRSNRSIKVDTDAGANTYFNGGSEMTVSFWKKGAHGGMWNAYVGKYGDVSGYRIMHHSNDTNPQTLSFGRSGATLSPEKVPTSITQNNLETWFNYTFTFKANQTANIYENGILIGTAGAGSAMIANSAPMGIGSNFNPAGTAYDFVSSRMDEVYFYNKQLTALQTMQLTGGHIWDGTAADNNWSAGNWAVPSGAPGAFTAGATPTASRYMFIDQAASAVTLNDDYTAYSLSLGTNNASALTINATKTLTSTLVVNVGASGTLQVDGGLTTTTFNNRGSSTFSAGSVLTFSGAGSTLALRSGTLTYNSTTPTTPHILAFYGGGLTGTGGVNAITKYEVRANTTVTLNLGGATTGMDVYGSFKATLTGTNTYGGQTSMLYDSRMLANDGVGLPSLSPLKMSYATFETGADLIRPFNSGATTPGSMDFTGRCSFSAVGGPARVGFGTKDGLVVTPENLIWGSGALRSTAEGLVLNSTAATHPLEFINPIDLNGPTERKIFIPSANQPVTFSGALTGSSGGGGMLKLGSDFGGSSTTRMILTSPDNSYTGKTTIQIGSIEIGGAGRLGLGNYAGAIDIQNSSTFKYNSSANQILAGVVGGTNGKLLKDNTGTLTLTNGNTYTGVTTVTNGVLRLDHANALPGGIAGAFGSNLTLNGGVVGLGNGDFTRGFGSASNQVRFTGSGGFAAYTADRSVDFGGAAAEVTWGTGSFGPDGQALILGAADATHMVTVLNPLYLGTAGRTIRVDNGSAADDGMLAATITGTLVANIGDSGGLTKTGTGSLRLDGAQSYNYLTANAGTTNVNGAFTTLTAEVAVNNPGTTLRFGTVSQTLGSLTIGAGATVIFTSGAASGSFGGGDGKGAGFGGGATVPEPGTLGLVLVGALGMLNRRRRA